MCTHLGPSVDHVIVHLNYILASKSSRLSLFPRPIHFWRARDLVATSQKSKLCNLCNSKTKNMNKKNQNINTQVRLKKWHFVKKTNKKTKQKQVMWPKQWVVENGSYIYSTSLWELSVLWFLIIMQKNNKITTKKCSRLSLNEKRMLQFPS